MMTPATALHPHFFANSGPASGPIRHRDISASLSVMGAADASISVGSAQLAGWVIDDRGAVATFRLLIGSKELPGLFSCVDRQFLEVIG